MGILAFISYATVDSERFQISLVASKLSQYSEIDEVLYWEEHMYDDIMKYMNDNLKLCHAVVVFCSPGALRSESVELEWMAALKLNKIVVPVFVEPNDIPPLLTTKLGVQYDVSNIDKSVVAIHQLILKKQRQEEQIRREEKYRIEESATSGTDGLPLSLESVAKLVSEAIFNDETSVLIGEKEYPVEVYSKSKVRYVHTKNYKFMEQNLQKKSKYAQMAREGKKIVWVMKFGKFFARLIEDEFVYL